jgi:hypothetical protein
MRMLKAAPLLAVGWLAVAGHAEIEQKLEPPFKELGHIHGYLIAPSGEGLTGVVSLRTMDGKKISLHVSNSNRRGRFDIDNLLPGKYKLEVESLGFNVVGLDTPEPVVVEVTGKKVARPVVTAR